MMVNEDYLNELLKYDFTSTKKGRGYSSLLVQRKINNKMQGQMPGEQQIPNNQAEVIYPPEGVMDVSRWYNSLTKQ